MFKIMPVLLFILINFVSSTYANDQSQVLLMGTFHFENPGLDTVKTDKINVMTDESQKYLQKLAENIASFNPSIVLLEFDEKNTKQINDEYQQYLKNAFELPANEIYQIGFRVARLAGVKAIASFDERTIEWKGGALYEYMETKDKASYDQHNKVIAELSENIANIHKTLNLQNILKLNNSSTHDNINKNLYMDTNHVGAAAGNFVGADAAASWWHRNFRMYAKIQNHAKKHKKIFALAGQGHTAIIKDLMAIDSSIQQISMEPFL